MTMQAALNTRYGSPDVLELARVERPRVGPEQILIQLRASSVTEGDRRLRAADYPGLSAIFGRLVTGLVRPRHAVGGSTFAGRVVEVGAQVTRFHVGDDVFGSTMHGAYAEYLAVSAKEAVALMPQSLSYAEAAAIAYGGGTARAFLRDMAKLKAGERVLIVGASGGVGRMAIQLAKYMGAHVTGVCSAHADLVRELGADAVINYKRHDFTQMGKTWDVIFDATEGNHFRSFRSVLTPAGRYLTLYMSLRVLFEMMWTRLVGGPRALTGVALGGPDSSNELRDLAERGALRAVIARRFPLEQTRAAHHFFEATRPHGSVVIEIGSALASQTLRQRFATRTRRGVEEELESQQRTWSQTVPVQLSDGLGRHGDLIGHRPFERITIDERKNPGVQGSEACQGTKREWVGQRQDSRVSPQRFTHDDGCGFA